MLSGDLKCVHSGILGYFKTPHLIQSASVALQKYSTQLKKWKIYVKALWHIVETCKYLKCVSLIYMVWNLPCLFCQMVLMCLSWPLTSFTLPGQIYIKTIQSCLTNYFIPIYFKANSDYIVLKIQSSILENKQLWSMVK